jgi:hypothetical protein
VRDTLGIGDGADALTIADQRVVIALAAAESTSRSATMRAVVIYESMYGCTHEIASAVGAGLERR